MSRRICTRCMGQMLYEYETGETPAEWACLACGHREPERPPVPLTERERARAGDRRGTRHNGMVTN